MALIMLGRIVLNYKFRPNESILNQPQSEEDVPKPILN